MRPLPALSAPALITLVLIPILLYIRRHLTWRYRSHGRPLLPGPHGLPIIGNMFNLPKLKQWLGFQELSARYGDILHFEVLGDSIVVLGSAEVIMEFLDKRSANTSDRTENVLIELTGADAVVNHYPAQQTMATRFLAKLLQDPSRFQDHIRYTFSAALMELLYDIQVLDEDDEYLNMVESVLEGISEGLVPGRYLVEVLPFLRYVPDWFPGAGFKKRFLTWRTAAHELMNAPAEHVKETMGRQEGGQCVVRDLLSKASSVGVEGPALAEEWAIIKGIATVAFAAGSDTTFSTLQATFLAMSLYPEVLKKAQAELDAVVGPTRLPDFDFGDKDSLVYVNAIIREASRWLLVLPLGIPHCTSADDKLHGYFIPKGTVLLPNVWACMHDPQVFPDPEVFRPERFIRDGKLDTTVRDPFHFTFGFGRRICPGRYFAESSMFINISAVLHVFDIGPPVDEAGVPIKVVPELTDGLIAYPQDCRCTIKPRSPAAEKLILKSVQAGRAYRSSPSPGPTLD